MDLSGLSRIAARETPPEGQKPSTARVVKVAADGVWVAPFGDDTRHPIGPCRGSAAVGEVVLVVPTQELPWAVAMPEVVTPLPQLHPNPGFEAVSLSTVGSGGSTVESRLMPDGWSWFWGTGIRLLTSDVKQRVTGSRSLKVTLPDPDSSAQIMTGAFPAAPPAWVSVSGWARSTGPAVWLQVLTGTTPVPDYFDGASTVTDSPPTSVGETWTKIAMSVKVPAGHTHARFVLNANASVGGAAPGDVWFDETTSAIDYYYGGTP